MPVFAILGAAASAQLTLLPYAYLADPLPVYHQSQDTRIGVHAYSYAGGPSAKEEVRGLDGVTRGSYSYIDAHGILQSVFYVADENGFRVAATNLPDDHGDPPQETSEILVARNAQEHAKVTAQEPVGEQEAKKVEDQGMRAASRAKRSLEASADQDQTENPSSQADQADRDSSPRDSHEPPAPEKKAAEDPPVIAPVYGGLLRSVLIPRLTGAATSHQSRVDIHNNFRLKAVQPLETIGILTEPAYKALLLPAQLPLAISHQNRLQVHSDLRAVETSESNPKVSENQSQLPVVADLQPLPVVAALRDYNENRIQLHKTLGLEGPNHKDAVKVDRAPATVIDTLPAISVVASKGTLPVVSAVPSATQIHRNVDFKVALPIASEQTVYVAPYAQPIATWPIYARSIAQSSQYRSQIHSSEKIELAK
jgi:hypothetical protein